MDCFKSNIDLTQNPLGLTYDLYVNGSESALLNLRSDVKKEVQLLKAKTDTLLHLQQQVDLGLALSARRRVPPEIWSHIFLFAIFIGFDPWTLPHFINIMLTCRDWHDILIYTPEVWSHLHLTIVSDTSCDQARSSLERRIALSRDYPLSVSVKNRVIYLQEKPGADRLLGLLLGQLAPRISSLWLDFGRRHYRTLLPKLKTPFKSLQAIHISGLVEFDDIIPDFHWQTTANLFPNVRSLSLLHAPGIPTHVQWNELNSFTTDDLQLLAEALHSGVLSAREVVLGAGDCEPLYRPDAIFKGSRPNTTIERFTLQFDKLGLSDFMEFVNLQSLQRMALKCCLHMTFEQHVGPHLSTFLRRTHLVYLALEVDLDEINGFAHLKFLKEAFKNSLPCLKVLKIVEFCYWIPSKLRHCSFPLSALCHGSDPVLPSLETFIIRVHHERFTRWSESLDVHRQRESDVRFRNFLLELEGLVADRINLEFPGAKEGFVPLKTLVVKGGGRSLDYFPDLRDRFMAWKQRGLEFYFDETDREEEDY